MKAYQERDQKKKSLLSLKNRYFAIIYGGVLKHKPVREIHKELYDATINKKVYDPALFVMATKLTKKAKKLDNKQEINLLALAILDSFTRNKVNDKAKKIINHDLIDETEKKKDKIIKDFLTESREKGKIFYLSSSHDDCAEDHKPYQGKIYIDANWKSIASRPDKIQKYLNTHDVKTFQWVIGAPAWLITRPHCRHYFVALSTNEVLHTSIKKMKNRHHTHSDEGDRDFQTPPKAAIEEYEDRLRYLRALYREHPSDKLKRMIEKTELLIKKWKKIL